jgi:hypothetical protein
MMTRKPIGQPRKLTNEEKLYVVRRLAAYDKPVAIARGLTETFGVTISPQAIEHYDPERPAGHDLAPHWREVFREARKAYNADTADIGHMGKPVRMRLRERMAIAAWEEGNYKLANEILNDVAKEAGDAFAGRNRQGQFAPGIPMTATILHTGPAEALPVSETTEDDEPEQDD